MVGDSKLSVLIDDRVSLGESFENFFNVSTVLHGNDSELIFFVHPDKECLLRIVEDTSGFRPIFMKKSLFLFILGTQNRIITYQSRSHPQDFRNLSPSLKRK